MMLRRRKNERTNGKMPLDARLARCSAVPARRTERGARASAHSNLQGNQLSGTIPATLGNLASLQSLCAEAPRHAALSPEGDTERRRGHDETSRRGCPTLCGDAWRRGADGDQRQKLVMSPLWPPTAAEPSTATS